MSISPEQNAILTATFEANEHHFVGGNAYVNEFSVCTLLDSVDPSWELFRLEEKRTDTRALVWLRLTVCSVNREGVGMSPLTRRKKDGTIIEVDEPEKNAATDALRRAARLFGVGRYLLLLPKDDRGNPLVTNVNELQRWLDWYNHIETPQSAPPARAMQPTAMSTSKVVQIPPNSAVDTIPFVEPGDKGWWTYFWQYAKPLYKQAGYADKHMAASAASLDIDASSMNVAEAINRVQKHLAEKQQS